jgi:hypothetical protein
MGDIEDAKKWREQQIAKRTNHIICEKCGLPKNCTNFDCELTHCSCGVLRVFG